MPVAVWFRKDLRIADNPALTLACQTHDTVYGLYVDCPKQELEHHQSAIQRDFIRRNLDKLNEALTKLGIRLFLLSSDKFDGVPHLLAKWVTDYNIQAIYLNEDRGINEQRRDQAVERTLPVPLHHFTADCIVPPGSLTTGSGKMYQVFTPFRTAWLNYVVNRDEQPLPAPAAPQAPAQLNTDAEQPLSLSLKDFKQTPKDSREWPAGESSAQSRLAEFCKEHLRDYQQYRDFPARPATSSLSPYLALGVLSPRQCLQAIKKALSHLPVNEESPGFSWLNELVWREFYRHLLQAHPRLSMNKAFKPGTEKVNWSNREDFFQHWCEGTTGFPVVDAAMRCLNQTGWMHNRLRMIVASFLTKDLHIDWRWGERYFMSRLIDGDLAANNGGWQWSASTGADAAPYFRIFNPTTQGKRFDPTGEFIKRWVPEVADVPSKHIHTPHKWLSAQVNHQSPHAPYPLPLVDHKQARLEAIALFKNG